MKIERSACVLFALIAVVLVLAASPVIAGDREGDRPKERDLKKILSGLEQGIGALKALGMEDEAARLTKIAKDVYRKHAGRNKEREAAQHQIEVMRIAMKALLEADKHDAADRLEHKIHAIELSLKGRRDDEANHIRETAPKKGEVAELLHWASKLWMEFGHESKANMIMKLADQFAGRESRRGKEGSDERRMLERHIEILHHAMGALREMEKRDLVEQLEREVHALKMDLEGRKDREAMSIRKKAPKAGSVTEILMYSADLWKKFGNHDKAGACAELGQYYLQRYRKEQAKERGHREGREHGEGREHAEGREGGITMKRIEELEQQIEELMKMMSHLREKLENLKRDAR